MTRNNLADRAVTNRELSNPIFTAAVDPNSTVSSAQSVGVDQSLTRKIEQVGGGIYDVGFQQDVSQIVYSATPAAPGAAATSRRVVQPPVARRQPRTSSRSSSVTRKASIRPSFHLIVVC